MFAPLAAVLLAASVWAEPPARIGVRDEMGCTPEQRAMIASAKPEARRRALAARDFARTASASADPTEKARFLAYYRLLSLEYSPADIPNFIVSLGKIADFVQKSSYRCAPRHDPECGGDETTGRGGYVDNREAADIIHLCPRFFASNHDRVSTLDHEAAHLLDEAIWDLANNRDQPTADRQPRWIYCFNFDCETRCAGSDGPIVEGRPRPYLIADNWAHFIHCASGQSPDYGTVIEVGRPKKKGR